ncbi:hypothetical protein [Bremerella cremea]|uniref:hypothetical protein n=1 Tax=Bremerella cremea TaxID=1031537 RepID=UPI0031EDFBFA
MGRRTFLSILLTWALACPALGADFVTVGFWNIEHLGATNSAQRPIALAEYIAASGVDVLGLCEIYDTDDGPERRNEQLDTAFAILNEEDDVEWKYELFPNRIDNDKSQLCAIAWNAKQVTRDGDAFPIDVDDDPNDEFFLWDRKPHAVKFSTGNGRTDFVVIPVHMKSNVKPRDQARARGRTGEEFGAGQRELEAAALVAKLNDVRTHFGGEQDLIILGDTNIKRHTEKAVELITDAGFVDLNIEDFDTYLGDGAPFDRIFVSISKEFVFTRQRVLVDSAPKEHREYLSDHYAISTTFRTKADDD